MIDTVSVYATILIMFCAVTLALVASKYFEIRDRTYHIPLGTYPDPLKKAAQLLDQKKNDGGLSCSPP